MITDTEAKELQRIFIDDYGQTFELEKVKAIGESLISLAEVVYQVDQQIRINHDQTIHRNPTI